ncbi:MAG TPA: hypothetical protein VGD09_17480 [Blastococcus sp.]
MSERISFIIISMAIGFFGAAVVYMAYTLPGRIKDALREQPPRRRATDVPPK